VSSGRLWQFFHNPFLHPSARRVDKRASWLETTATVADCLDLSGLWDKSHTTADLYTVRFTYWVEGRMYSGCFKSRVTYSAGEELQVSYDPLHPERNSADPEEKLRTELLIAASIGLVALYFALAWRF